MKISGGIALAKFLQTFCSTFLQSIAPVKCQEYNNQTKNKQRSNWYTREPPVNSWKTPPSQ